MALVRPPYGASWQFLTVNTLGDTVDYDLYGASVGFSFDTAVTGFVDGVPIRDIWQTLLFESFIHDIALPVIYDEDGLVIPYRHKLRLSDPLNTLRGTIRLLTVPSAMYSQKATLRLRFMPLVPFGTVEPFQVQLNSAAALFRCVSFDPVNAAMEGILLSQFISEPLQGIALDFPPVYDASGRVIPYQQELRFAAAGAQPIQGGFTFVDVVPNR